MLEATSLYKLVAERGAWSSLSRWALESYYLKACTFLMWKASEQGNKHAALLIGDAYYYGRGIERDYDCAADAYMHVKLQLNDQAMFNLGYMHGHGREMPNGETDADDGCGNKAMIYMKIVEPYVTRSIIFSFSLCLIWELRSQHEECRHLKEECRHLEEQLRLKNDTLILQLQCKVMNDQPWIRPRSNLMRGLSCCSNLQNMVAARIKDLYQALDTARYVGSDETLILTEAYDHQIYRYLDGGDSLHSTKDDECIGSEDDEIMKIMLRLDMMVPMSTIRIPLSGYRILKSDDIFRHYWTLSNEPHGFDGMAASRKTFKGKI
uniref:ERAD-associated E3 ubiquitin-protein ligase component HRD3A n=1 Tax=Tanacetum cinerariifolium TaxID=118510 RepID=A0A6L2MYZ8_TANCI|nr:hypothetical protein [Tanacetum cinerariifolium]